jgi:hypothetical protein
VGSLATRRRLAVVDDEKGERGHLLSGQALGGGEGKPWLAEGDYRADVGHDYSQLARLVSPKQTPVGQCLGTKKYQDVLRWRK